MRGSPSATRAVITFRSSVTHRSTGVTRRALRWSFHQFSEGLMRRHRFRWANSPSGIGSGGTRPPQQPPSPTFPTRARPPARSRALVSPADCSPRPAPRNLTTSHAELRRGLKALLGLPFCSGLLNPARPPARTLVARFQLRRVAGETAGRVAGRHSRQGRLGQGAEKDQPEGRIDPISGHIARCVR